jgi:hypothetical protein
MAAMATVSADDTDTVLLGSGALAWSWYMRVSVARSTGTWTLTFADGEDPDYTEDDETPRWITVTHADALKAVRRIVRADRSTTGVGATTQRECRTLLFKGADESDFDSDSADQVLQVAGFGKVVYG